MPLDYYNLNSAYGSEEVLKMYAPFLPSSPFDRQVIPAGLVQRALGPLLPYQDAGCKMSPQ